MAESKRLRDEYIMQRNTGAIRKARAEKIGNYSSLFSAIFLMVRPRQLF